MEDKKLLAFIEKSNIIHNHKYDYSLVEYVSAHTAVNIICPIHGVFPQKPTFHTTRKMGCPHCSSSRRKQTILERYGVDNISNILEIQDRRKQTILEKYGVTHPRKNKQVLEKQKITNLERYGVENPSSNVKIKNKRTQTNLTKYGVENPQQCADIQSRSQQTNLERYGHINPAHGELAKRKIRNTCLIKYNNEFFNNREKAKLTNLTKYNVEYVSQSSIVKDKIRNTNIKKYGVHNPSQQHMINILPLIEDYDWLFDQYINQNKTATQIADELEISDTTLGRYLHYHEIEIKQSYKFSFKCIQWLNSIMEQEGINIQHALNGGEYQIPGTKYWADGYCTETNTIYEFHGDYWHGNPKVYSTDSINEVTGLTMGELYQQTISREQDLRELGYNLVIVWENDFSLTNKLINT